MNYLTIQNNVIEAESAIREHTQLNKIRETIHLQSDENINKEKL